MLDYLFKQLFVPFDEVAFARSHAGEVHLDEVFHRLSFNREFSSEFRLLSFHLNYFLQKLLP